MYGLLKGVRVVDLSTVVLGPYATQLIADMGADVIKVEPKGGDVFRSARPGRSGGDGAGFLNLNRNKRSIVLDLAQPEDRKILDGLVRTADVFVHNLRDAAARKLGVDYETISAAAPDIVYCSARGYGRGPLGSEPAYDDCIQAASGLAWLNANEQGEPRFVRTILCDKIAGLHLAFAIAAGIAARARTGRGCNIETPMFEAMASFLLVEQLSGQSFVPALPDRGYVRLDAAGRKPYRTSDGYVTIMPYTAVQWRRFLKLVGADELANSADLSDGEKRSGLVDTLYAVIEQAAPNRTTAEWLELLRDVDIPCAPVNHVDDLPRDEHLSEAGLFKVYTHKREGQLMYAGSPFTVATEEQTSDRAPPALDEHRNELLAEIRGPDGRSG